MSAESEQDTVWNAYIDKYNSEPNNAQQLLNFSKNKSYNVPSLSFASARQTLNRNRGKGRVYPANSKANPISVSSSSSAIINAASKLQEAVEPADLSIFKQGFDRCDDSLLGCPSLNRLAVTLRYYQKSFDQQYRDTFMHFINNIYPQKELLNDYIHLMRLHQDQIENIRNDYINNQGIIKCNIKTCPFTQRHHRISDDNKTTESDSTEFNFIKETIDSLHFYIMHMFEVGLRIPRMDNDIDPENEEKKDNNIYFDQDFDRIHTKIRDLNETTPSFLRFDTENNSKFNIKTDKNGTEDDNKTQGIIDGGATYLDEFLTHLQQDGIEENIIENLRIFMKNEEYETESLIIDIRNNGQNGNISQCINNPKYAQSITNAIGASVGMFYLQLYDVPDIIIMYI